MSESRESRECEYCGWKFRIYKYNENSLYCSVCEDTKDLHLEQKINYGINLIAAYLDEIDDSVMGSH